MSSEATLASASSTAAVERRSTLANAASGADRDPDGDCGDRDGDGDGGRGRGRGRGRLSRLRRKSGAPSSSSGSGPAATTRSTSAQLGRAAGSRSSMRSSSCTSRGGRRIPLSNELLSPKKESQCQPCNTVYPAC